ncbi:hypothetical protein ACLOJK_039110 [Asimina triloba]
MGASTIKMYIRIIKHGLHVYELRCTTRPSYQKGSSSSTGAAMVANLRLPIDDHSSVDRTLPMVTFHRFDHDPADCALDPRCLAPKIEQPFLRVEGIVDDTLVLR